MTVMILRKHGMYKETWQNVETWLWEHQKGNGSWVVLYFKRGTPEYEDFKNQRGELSIGTDNYDQIITY